MAKKAKASGGAQPPAGRIGVASRIEDLGKSINNVIDTASDITKGINDSPELSKSDSQSLFDNIKEIQSSLGKLTKELKLLRSAASSKLVAARRKSPSSTSQPSVKLAPFTINGEWYELIDGKPVKVSPPEETTTGS